MSANVLDLHLRLIISSMDMSWSAERLAASMFARNRTRFNNR